MTNPEILELEDLQGYTRLINNKIELFPVRLKDALKFYDYAIVLNIDKNATDDVEVLRMSYLKFLILVSEVEINRHIRDKLTALLKLVLRCECIDYVANEKGKIFISVDNEYTISEFEFNKVRTHISEQNMIDLDDENVNPEFKKKYKEAQEFMAKRSSPMASFSQRILSYQYEMKLPLDVVFNMTLYQFNRSLETISHIKNADILQQARYGGMATFKDESKLPTWLSAIEKNIDDPLLMDADKLKKDMDKVFN